MMTQTDKITKAWDLGKEAFRKGEPGVPALDPAFLLLLEGLKVGESLPILQAWIDAWTEENLS